MADTKGYVICDHAHCNEIAEVREASGNRSNLYTVCPACKTDQSNGKERQRWLMANIVPEDEIHTLKPEADKPDYEPDYEAEQEAEQEAAKASNNAPHSRLEKVAAVVKKAAEEADIEAAKQPPDKPPRATKAPLIFGALLAVFALIFALINKSTSQENVTSTN